MNLENIGVMVDGMIMMHVDGIMAPGDWAIDGS